MAPTLLGRLAGIVIIPCAVLGFVIAAETPSLAQITVKCWKEYCSTDPDTGKEYCIKESIPCPPEDH